MGNLGCGNKKVKRKIVLYLLQGLQFASCFCPVGGISSVVKNVRSSKEFGNIII